MALYKNRTAQAHSPQTPRSGFEREKAKERNRVLWRMPQLSWVGISSIGVRLLSWAFLNTSTGFLRRAHVPLCWSQMLSPSGLGVRPPSSHYSIRCPRKLTITIATPITSRGVINVFGTQPSPAMPSRRQRTRNITRADGRKASKPSHSPLEMPLLIRADIVCDHRDKVWQPVRSRDTRTRGSSRGSRPSSDR